MYKYPCLTLYRIRSKLSQQQLAQILGIRQQQYSLWESGKREIPVHILIALADIYGVTLDELVGR